MKRHEIKSDMKQTVRGPRAALRGFRADERGSVLAMSAVAFLGLLGLLALAVELGTLYETRGQAQRTADSAALAGAAALVDFGNDPSVVDTVNDYVWEYVDQNPVRGVLGDVQEEDIVVDLDQWRVTVTVHRTAERDNAVDTLFGKIIGFDTVDVSAIATAEAAEAGEVNCLLPLAMPDRWDDNNSDDAYDAPPDYYSPHPNDDATGYSDADIGLEVVIKPFKTTGQMNPSWYFPWRPPGQQGGNDYRDNIAGCVDPELTYGFGDVVDTEPGAMIGPTKQGFEDLIAQDPDIYWEESLRDGNGCATYDGTHCAFSSPRIRPMPLFDPTQEPDPGSKPFTFTNFINVFVDRIQGNEVYGYYLGLAGVPGGGGGAGGGGGGAAVRFARLIQ